MKGHEQAWKPLYFGKSAEYIKYALPYRHVGQDFLVWCIKNTSRELPSYASMATRVDWVSEA
jgi:hypothetical protein